MGRLPLPLNSHGAISLSEVRPKVWRARCRYRDGTGRILWVERSGASKTAAQRALNAAIAEHRGRHVDTLRPHHKVSVAIDLWLERLDGQVAEGGVAATTADRYRSAARALRPLVGELRIGEATPARLDATFEALAAQGLSVASRRLRRAVLSQVFKLVVRHEALAVNPVRDVAQIADRRRAAPRALTAEQRRRLFAWLAGDETAAQRLARQRDLPDFILFMIGTGVRIGEAAALRWCDVDLDGRVFETGAGPVLMSSITISGTVVGVEGFGLAVHPGKTAQSLRVVPVPRAVVEMLRARRPADPDPAEPVFATVGRHGLTWRDPKKIGKFIRDMRAELGWPWLTSHVFRKTTATILHEAGVSDLSLGEHIGHTDRATLLNVYLGAGDVDPRLVNALDAALVDS